MLFELISQWIFQVLFMFGYVSKPSAFPKALTPKEEAMYLEKLALGDSEARKILIEHNLRLVAHIAKKYGDETTADDLISIGTIGLIKGIDTYNTERRVKLSAYISKCIENEVRMYLRSNKKRLNDVSLEDSIGTDKEGNNMTYADILPADTRDICDSIWTKLESAKLADAMKGCLSEDEIKIICMRYGLCDTKKQTQKEIASQLGISRSYVSRIEKRCLKKLRDRLYTMKGKK